MIGSTITRLCSWCCLFLPPAGWHPMPPTNAADTPNGKTQSIRGANIPRESERGIPMSAFLILLYIAAAVAANLLVFVLGPWFSSINAFVLIGLDLTMRDILHERLSRLQLLAVILVGGVITWGINPAARMIAIASATAFTAAALADWLMYALLHRRPWLVRANASNVVGAAVDSVIFPTLAFGAFLPAIIGLQFLAKAAGGAVWSLIMQGVTHARSRPAVWWHR